MFDTARGGKPLFEEKLSNDAITDLSVSDTLFCAVSASKCGLWKYKDTTFTEVYRISPPALGHQLRGCDLCAACGTEGSPSLFLGSVSRAEKISLLLRYDVDAPKLSKQIVTVKNDASTSVKTSSDGKWVAIGTANGVVIVYSAHTLRRIMSHQPHSFFVSGVCFSPQGEAVISCSGDRTVHIQPVVVQRNTWWLILFILSLVVLAVAFFFGKNSGFS